MPPSEEMPGESFRGLILRLRGRTGLTQRELASRIGVHITSIQGWEAGSNYPGVASLQALITEGLQAGGFTAGREREDAQALWAAALRDAPRFRMPFDGAWFERLASGPREPVQDSSEPSRSAPDRSTGRTTTSEARRESWGEAPDVADFLNRVSEREMVSQWVLDEGSRLVAVLGLGGIGKSLLATRLARDLAPAFEHVFWRSLRDAPTPNEWLAEALGFLAPDDTREARGEAALLRRLLELLGETRCLLVLDNVETVLQPGGQAGDYRPGYERYGTLLRQVAEAPHQSCLMITSREEPAELGPLLGARGPVRSLELTGFGTADGRALLQDKELVGDDGAWHALVERYGGNGLALKVVGETTRELFGGSIAEYLEFAAETSGVMVGGVRQLLEAQVQRLSDVEQELLLRMAVAREPVSLVELAVDLGPRVGRAAVLEALEGLRRRSLLERTERSSLFGLHSVVLEYVTDALVEDAAQELASGHLDRLLRQPLLKATGKEYVRRSQERLIDAPLVERLVEACGSVRAAEQRLLGLLTTLRQLSLGEQGYGPGNLVNLLRLLRGELKGVDLSGLSIRQAYIQDVPAQGASLAGANLSESVLGDAFNHPTSTTSLSADGAFLAVGTAGGEVCRWRVADRTLLATLAGHAGPIWGMAQSEDGRVIASGGVDGTVRLWQAGNEVPLSILHGHIGGVRGVALSRDGRLAASGGVDGTVRLWDALRGHLLTTLHGHTGDVYAMALSQDGQLVASGGLDGTVRLWDAESGQLLTTLEGHTSGVRGVALSGDGRLVGSAGLDATVRLWEVATGRPLAILQGHSGGVRGVALSWDGSLVVSGGFDEMVRLWDGASGRPHATLRGHTGLISGVALSRDGRLIASGGTDGTVRVWDGESGLSLVALQGQSDRVTGVALSRDGRVIASGSYSGAVRIWDAEAGTLVATLHGHTRIVLNVALSGDGRLVASSSYDGTVRLRDVSSGSTLHTLVGHTGLCLGVAVSVDGRLVASSGFDGTVRLWDADSGRPVTILRGHAGPVRGVALSGDARLVASGSVDATVRLWEAESGRELATLRGHTGEIYAVAFSEDGRLVASSGLDGAVRLWEVATGRLLATLRGHTGEIFSVVLSADGRLIASASFDGTVRLWETEGGRPLVVMHGHIGGVWGVALNADNTLVVSGGDDGTVRLWDVKSGDLLRTLRLERRYEALDITGLTGITDAQRGTLFALGAVERPSHARSSS